MYYKKTICQGCFRTMFVQQPYESLNPYLVALGFKHSGKHWHPRCLDDYLKNGGYVKDYEKRTGKKW